jgi:predicted nucleotidyltransferase
METVDVLAYLRTHKHEFEQRFGVIHLALFGSFARGEGGETSDVDIAVELDSAHKNLTNFLGLKRTLEAALKRPVDLGIESTLKPAVKEAVKDEMIYV